MIADKYSSDKLFPEMEALMPEHYSPIINLDDHNVVSIYENTLVTEDELPVSLILPPNFAATFVFL